MKKFISISANPGKTGSKYYNGYFASLGLPYEYEARGYTTIEQAMADIKTMENLGGISVSMPFKNKIIGHLDIADQSVQLYQSCNTIKILGNIWKGYNCDLAGARYIKTLIDNNDSIAILGNGSMGKMISKVITGNVRVFSRSLANWSMRHENHDVFINATSLGTINQESPLDIIPPGTRLVIDLAININNLQKQCLELKIDYVNGIEFYKHQFMEQFLIYTGISPPPEIFEELALEKNI